MTEVSFPKGSYKIEDIYSGGYSSLDSEKNQGVGEWFTGYQTNVGQLGVSTDPRTGNILKEASDKLAPGQKTIELSLIQPETFEAIPKQQLEEVNRLSKLTGVDMTVHGPLFDASGATQQGFDKQQREIVERKIINALERSRDVNPDGNVPVTFHTANQLPGARWRKIPEAEQKERGIEEKEEPAFMPVVNQETGQIQGAKIQEKFRPRLTEEGKIQKEFYDVKKQIRVMNESEWDNSLQQLITPVEHANRIIRETEPIANEVIRKIQKGTDYYSLNPEEQKVYLRFQNAAQQLEDVKKHLDSLYDKAYKYAPKGKEKEYESYLNDIANNFNNYVKENGNISGFATGLQEFMDKLRLEKIGQVGVPELYKSAEEYALEKSQETYGNAAWNIYQKAKKEKWKGMPIINIENPPAGFGLSRAEDVKNMVEGSRKKFIEQATANGISEKEAEKEAEKLIGVTWDVGHINQLRQFGYSSEDIQKEAEKVAPLVKHVHLSDNFGMENTEQVMGAGNVDLKEVMKKLGKKGEEAKKIVEAAHWWQFQQTSPIGTTMEALGSPVYGMHMSPYWNQVAGMQGGYFGGYGMMLPQVNYETFGAGFSQLPAELGGQRPGAQGGRMSGRGME